MKLNLGYYKRMDEIYFFCLCSFVARVNDELFKESYNRSSYHPFPRLVSAAPYGRRCWCHGGFTAGSWLVHIWHAEVAKGANTRGSFTLHGAHLEWDPGVWDCECVCALETQRERERVCFWPAAGEAKLLLLRDLWVHNVLVPRRETGTDWKHGPPRAEPPRTDGSVIISWASRGRRLNVRATHHQLHTGAS